MFAPDFWGWFEDQCQGWDLRGTPFPPCTLGILCRGGKALRGHAAAGLPCAGGCLKTMNSNFVTHTQTGARNERGCLGLLALIHWQGARVFAENPAASSSACQHLRARARTCACFREAGLEPCAPYVKMSPPSEPGTWPPSPAPNNTAPGCLLGTGLWGRRGFQPLESS